MALFKFVIIANMIDGKNVILFVSNGSVGIAQQYNITQKLGHKPDTAIVVTMFLDPSNKGQIM